MVTNILHYVCCTKKVNQSVATNFIDTRARKQVDCIFIRCKLFKRLDKSLFYVLGIVLKGIFLSIFTIYTLCLYISVFC